MLRYSTLPSIASEATDSW